jgi:PAS domain S-box-containing protein
VFTAKGEVIVKILQFILKRPQGTLFTENESADKQETFHQELNEQCSRIILFAALIAAFVWLPYISIDKDLYPGEPIIIAIRIGFSLTGLSVLVLRVFKRFSRYNLFFLVVIIAYLEIATALITGLTRADSFYIGRYLFILTVLALLPIHRLQAWSILALSLMVFFIAGFMKGMPIDSVRLRYELNNLAVTASIVALAIYLLDRLRFESWQKSLKIKQQNFDLRADKVKIDELVDTIRLSETKYRKFFDNSPIGIFLTTADGKVLSANRAALEVLKFESVDAVNAAGLPNLYVNREDRAVLREKVKNGPVSGFETAFRRADGEIISVSIGGYLVDDEDGHSTLMEGTIEDITERKRAENILRESEEKYKILVENTNDIIWAFDLKSMSFSFSSNSVERILGYTAEEAAGKTLDDIFDQETKKTLLDGLRKMISEGKSSDRILMEAEHIAKNGSRVWVEINIVAKRDELGNIVAFTGVSRDISDRKRSEMALRESERRLSDIIDFLPLATMVIDREGRVVAWNREMEKVTGVNRVDILGKGDHEYAVPFYGVRRPILIDLVFTAQDELATRYSQVRRDGGILSAEAYIPQLGIILVGYASALYGSDGNIIGAIESVRDITDIRRVEADLKEAKDEADAANRSKSLFLANMSHEIRTPMNAILGFAQLMERDPSLSQQSREHLEIINRSGEHLLTLINDILEMSKIEAGKATFVPNIFDLYALLENIERMFRARTDARNLSFIVEKIGEIPRWVVTDEGKLRQVIINLLGNAVKFTEEGGIAMRLSAAAFNQESVNLRFEVEDTGPGMAEDEIGHLFQAFEQTQAGIKSGGTGLGLALSRGFVQVMGGSISVSSEVGKGTTFRFQVPVREGREEDVKLKEPKRRVLRLSPGQNEIRILIADDRDTNRRLLSSLLDPAGFVTRNAVNGEDAVQAVREWRPRAVLMDMTMPLMDGYEATRIIKTSPGLEDTVIIAVTASAFEDDRQRIIEAGADGYLPKPFKERELFETIARLTGAEYIYEEDGMSEKRPRETEDYSEMRRIVEMLPDSLISPMRDAVEGADLDRLNELAGKLAGEYPSFARGIEQMAIRYDYEALTELFSGERNQ